MELRNQGDIKSGTAMRTTGTVGTTGATGTAGKQGDNGNGGMWIMHLKARAVSPIFTGENKVEARKQRKVDKKLPTRRSGDGFATVNLSGVLRFYGEKIYKDDGACDVSVNAKGCGRSTCPTCDLFGFLGRKGRVLVDELKSTESFDKVVDVAIHPRIDRETGTIPQQMGSTIELEEIQEGTIFLANLIIKNPKEKDVEMLMAMLKAIELNGIGGWTRRGKGRVVFDVSMEKIGWKGYKDIGREEARKLLNPEKSEKDKKSVA